jgi:hypothetical protein
MDECLDMQSVDLNYGQMFFMMLGFLPVMMCLPCWFVAKFVHEPMANEYKTRYKEWVEEMKKPPPYEHRYPVEECEDGELRTETKINNLVLDKTPDGYVAMRYNVDEEGFEYWSDKNVTYKYLETVARKYVNAFDCPGIYINRGKLLKEKLNKLQEEIKKNIEDEENKKDGEDEEEEKEEEGNVFADLKKYNSSSKRTSELKKRITKSDIVCDEANKYIKRGKFSDNKSWMKPKEIEKEGSSTWSWLDWKNSQNKSD